MESCYPYLIIRESKPYTEGKAMTGSTFFLCLLLYYHFIAPQSQGVGGIMKHLSFFKSALLTLLILCSNFVWAHDFEVDGIYYNILSETDKTVEVTYGNERYTGYVTIPAAVKYNNTTHNVTSIGNNAFENCSGLSSITIPKSITHIANSAFYGCTGIKELHIEDSEIPISCNKQYYDPTDDFFEDSPIEYMYIGRDIINYSFSYFSKWKNTLKTVVIGDGMTIIPNSIFDSCYKLSSITIPDNVRQIENYAFYYCNIAEINLVEGLESIGIAAFAGCDIKSLTIPNSVTSIGRNAFNETTQLESIVVESGNKVYDSRNECNAIIETATRTLIRGCKTTIIPKEITNIANTAFYGCLGLTEIEIPSNITSVGNSAFYACTSLENIYFHSNPTIGTDAIPSTTTCHLVLDDSNMIDFNTANSNTYSDISYTRTISEGKYGTIMLPFAPDAASIENYAFYELVESGEGYMKFDEVAQPVANTPYIYTLREGKENVAITGAETTISSTVETPVVDGWQTIGSFTNQALDTSDGNYYAFSPSKNEINKITKNLTVLPYRAYFKSDNASKSAFSVYISGTTGVAEISSGEIDGFENGAIFDLSGRKVSEPEEGNIYIKNGKKIML